MQIQCGGDEALRQAITLTNEFYNTWKREGFPVKKGGTSIFNEFSVFLFRIINYVKSRCDIGTFGGENKHNDMIS